MYKLLLLPRLFKIPFVEVHLLACCSPSTHRAHDQAKVHTKANNNCASKTVHQTVHKKHARTATPAAAAQENGQLISGSKLLNATDLWAQV